MPKFWIFSRSKETLPQESDANEVFKNDVKDVIQTNNNETPPNNGIDLCDDEYLYGTPTVYYGVSLCSVFCGSSDNGEALVFTDKGEALITAKKYKGSRFKAFGKIEDAIAFANQPADKTSTPVCTTPEKSLLPPPIEFHGPSRQEIVKLRKGIEQGDLELFQSLVWSNPRYLISGVDTPTIMMEGYRYNALHVAAKHKQSELFKAIIETIEDESFLYMLYPENSPEIFQRRMHFIMDLYINMPEKKLSETPLHFASKFGCLEIVRLLVAHPLCDQKMKNKYQLEAKDIICERCSPSETELKRMIEEAFEERYFVPVMRAKNNGIQPLVCEPFSPEQGTLHEKLSICSLHSPELSIKALAGPMSPAQAKTFYKQWKTPPLKLCEENRSYGIRLSDAEKGLERIGRELAYEMNTKWTEYWPCLRSWCDISSPEGLKILNDHLKRERRIEVQNRGRHIMYDKDRSKIHRLLSAKFSFSGENCLEFRNTTLTNSELLNSSSESSELLSFTGRDDLIFFRKNSELLNCSEKDSELVNSTEKGDEFLNSTGKGDEFLNSTGKGDEFLNSTGNDSKLVNLSEESPDLSKFPDEKGNESVNSMTTHSELLNPTEKDTGLLTTRNEDELLKSTGKGDESSNFTERDDLLNSTGRDDLLSFTGGDNLSTPSPLSNSLSSDHSSGGISLLCHRLDSFHVTEAVGELSSPYVPNGAKLKVDSGCNPESKQNTDTHHVPDSQCSEDDNTSEPLNNGFNFYNDRMCNFKQLLSTIKSSNENCSKEFDTDMSGDKLFDLNFVDITSKISNVISVIIDKNYIDNQKEINSLFSEDVLPEILCLMKLNPIHKPDLCLSHCQIAQNVYKELGNEFTIHQMKTISRCLMSYIQFQQLVSSSSSDDEDYEEENIAQPAVMNCYQKRAPSPKQNFKWQHLHCVLKFLCQFIDNCVESKSCFCHWVPKGRKTRCLPRNSDKSNCRTVIEPVQEELLDKTAIKLTFSDSDSECDSETESTTDFFTPPATPPQESESSDSDEATTPEEGLEIYVEGENVPSKADVDIFRVIEKVPVDPVLYPHVVMWKHLISSKDKKTVESWQSPAVKKYRRHLSEMSSPSPMSPLVGRNKHGDDAIVKLQTLDMSWKKPRRRALDMSNVYN